MNLKNLVQNYFALGSQRAEYTSKMNTPRADNFRASVAALLRKFVTPDQKNTWRKIKIESSDIYCNHLKKEMQFLTKHNA